MMRVKLPFGGTTSEQLDAFAVIAEDYTPLGKGHLTTREAIQLHHIPLDRTLDIMQILGDAGLSTREACGTRCAMSQATRGPASAPMSPST